MVTQVEGLQPQEAKKKKKKGNGISESAFLLVLAQGTLSGKNDQVKYHYDKILRDKGISKPFRRVLCD